MRDTEPSEVSEGRVVDEDVGEVGEVTGVEDDVVLDGSCWIPSTRGSPPCTISWAASIVIGAVGARKKNEV